MMTGAAITLDEAGKARRARALSARVVARADLPSSTIDEAYALFAAVYDGTDRSRFVRDLSEKQWVILLHDRESGALRGFSTVLLRDIVTSRGPAQLFFSGDTVVHPAYWGQKVLQLATARLLLSLKLRAPSRPLYWFLISKGYRTYLLLANNFPRSIPRVGSADDPVLRALLSDIARERFGEAYDASTGIIRNGGAHEYVRTGVAPVSESALRNRHVRFFVDRNPDHATGDELACLAVVRVRDLMRSMARFTMHRALRAVGVSAARRRS
jgi:hypothetical protein